MKNVSTCFHLINENKMTVVRKIVLQVASTYNLFSCEILHGYVDECSADLLSFEVYDAKFKKHLYSKVINLCHSDLSICGLFIPIYKTFWQICYPTTYA